MKFGVIATCIVGAWATSCIAADVTVGFGDHLPPYIFSETQSGFEVEVFRESLAYRGHTMTPVFLPLKRVALQFAAGKFDAVMMDSGVDLSRSGGIYAQPAVLYDNVFITRADRHITIKQPEDLKGLSVLAFPGALQRYPQWLEEVDRAGNYREANNQALQVLKLQAGQTDVVLSDRYIFRYFSEQMNLRYQFTHPVVEQDFVVENPRDYRAIFRDNMIKKDFEDGLRHLKESGRYKILRDKYLK